MVQASGSGSVGSRESRAASGSPCRSSITRNARPSGDWSTSTTETTCGERMLALTRASWTNRATTFGRLERAGWRNLSAISVPRNSCRASKMVPMPPSPSLRTSRYLPLTRMPGPRLMRGSRRSTTQGGLGYIAVKSWTHLPVQRAETPEPYGRQAGCMQGYMAVKKVITPPSKGPSVGSPVPRISGVVHARKCPKAGRSFTKGGMGCAGRLRHPARAGRSGRDRLRLLRARRHGRPLAHERHDQRSGQQIPTPRHDVLRARPSLPGDDDAHDGAARGRRDERRRDQPDQRAVLPPVVHPDHRPQRRPGHQLQRRRVHLRERRPQGHLRGERQHPVRPGLPHVGGRPLRLFPHETARPDQLPAEGHRVHPPRDGQPAHRLRRQVREAADERAPARRLHRAPPPRQRDRFPRRHRAARHLAQDHVPGQQRLARAGERPQRGPRGPARLPRPVQHRRGRRRPVRHAARSTAPPR